MNYMYFRSWPIECNLKSEDKPTVPNRAILILKSRLKTRFWPEKHNFLVIKLPNHKDVKSYGCYIDINRMVEKTPYFLIELTLNQIWKWQIDGYLHLKWEQRRFDWNERSLHQVLNIYFYGIHGKDFQLLSCTVP